MALKSKDTNMARENPSKISGESLMIRERSENRFDKKKNQRNQGVNPGGRI